MWNGKTKQSQNPPHPLKKKIWTLKHTTIFPIFPLYSMHTVKWDIYIFHLMGTWEQTGTFTYVQVYRWYLCLHRSTVRVIKHPYLFLCIKSVYNPKNVSLNKNTCNMLIQRGHLNLCFMKLYKVYYALWDRKTAICCVCKIAILYREIVNTWFVNSLHTYACFAFISNTCLV